MGLGALAINEFNTRVVYLFDELIISDGRHATHMTGLTCRRSDRAGCKSAIGFCWLEFDMLKCSDCRLWRQGNPLQ